MTDTAFKVKGQGHQAALLTAVLMRQTAAVVTVGTYWPWKTTATLRSAGAAVGWVSQGTSVPTEEGGGWGISWRPPSYSMFNTHWLYAGPSPARSVSFGYSQDNANQ